MSLGLAAQSVACSGSPDSAPADSLRVRWDATGADEFTGLKANLDDARVYGRALNANEIEALYVGSP